MAFVFGLPKAFGPLHVNYFSSVNLAKLSAFFETYYIVMKRFGSSFINSPFEHVAVQTAAAARHFAIKSKVLKPSQLPRFTNVQVQDYLQSRCPDPLSTVIDIVDI